MGLGFRWVWGLDGFRVEGSGFRVLRGWGVMYGVSGRTEGFGCTVGHRIVFTEKHLFGLGVMGIWGSGCLRDRFLHWVC